MTTENVAVLFTDIVGSTELSQSLSPELADQARRSHFAVLRQAVAESGGTEVKNLGDGLMVVFTSASAALACGVAMQQGVAQANRGPGESIGLRVGLSGGEVSREDDDYFGDAVVEAARLCAACDSGQVLAADIVRLMAGRRSRIECRPLGERALKGLPDPVATVEVLWAPLGGIDDVAVVPLPARLAARPDVGVVGRDVEVDVLAGAYKRVVGGGGRELVLVSGEAGMGKTTLVADASRAAFESGAVVLFGHCEEELATPYQLFAEALAHWVVHAPEEQLLAHVTAHGSELARLVPALASRIPDLPPTKATDSDTERFLLFAAVVGLVSAVGGDRPVVLVLDDLQWADKGSLLLLRHLAGSDVPMRLLVLGTYRDSELTIAHPLVETLGALRRLDGELRVELDGLDDVEVMALMEAAAGHDLDDDAVRLAHAIYRETDGNPFFVNEVLRNLVETGAIRRNDQGRWEAEATLDVTALPDSVREVIGARVLRLGREAGRVLSVAAIIGRDFDLDLLAAATGHDEDDLVDILDHAATVALVRELRGTPGRYNFCHALIQHTLYDDMGPTRRARTHRRVAEALEALCGGRPGARVGELARHWTSATQPIDLTRAIGYSRQAGDAALAALAPADALRHYRKGLELFPQVDEPDPVLELDLAIGLGTAQRQTGDPAFRETLLGAARRAASLGDVTRLVAATLANDRGWYSSVGVIDAEKVAMLELALDRLPGHEPDRALLLANLCTELTYGSPIERRQELAREALAIAESADDDVVAVRVLNHVCYPLYVPQLCDQLMDRTGEALGRAESVGDSILQFWAAYWRACVAPLAGDIDELDRCSALMKSLVEKLDQPMLHWSYLIQRTHRALIAGDTGEAERLAAECLQIGSDSGQPDASTIFAMHLLGVNGQRGTTGDLIAVIEEIRANMQAISKAAVESALAIAYVEGGRLDDAREVLVRFADGGFELPADSVWLFSMATYADVAIECQDRTCAGPLFDRLAPWSDRLSTNGGGSTNGPVSHFLGGLATVLGRYAEAESYFARAASFNSRARATFFAAQTDLLWGRMLVRRGAHGDTGKARELLTRAQATAKAHGYGGVERRSSTALSELD